jgi:hypothetical protein
MTQQMWQEGDRVTWRCGESGYAMNYVPAVVLRCSGESDITIDIVFRLGDQWVREKRHVPPDSLASRRRYIARLDTPVRE